MASESTKKPEDSTNSQTETHERRVENVKHKNVKLMNNNKNEPSLQPFKTKENESRKVNLKQSTGKSPVIKGRENVSNTEHKCVKEMPNMAKNEQNKFFDAGDDAAGVSHDVVFLEAASKNSGVIQNE